MKRPALSSLLLVVLLGAFTLVPASPAAATSLTLGSVSGPPGASVTFTGATDNATAGWTLYWGSTTGTALTSGVASGGAASGSFTVPETPSGTYTLVLIDNVNATTGSATFTVTPSITVSPTSATPGTSLTVTGHGFAASETGLNLTFDGTAVASSLTAQTTGQWTATFNLPEAAGGASHVFDASGASTTATNVPDLAFTVTPVFSITPLTGPVGSQVTASGKGFAASETGISVTLDGVSAATATAGTTGTWTATFAVPSSIRGAHVVDAYGATTAAASVADLSFTVTTGLSVTPTSGTAGTAVTVTGTAFAASEAGIVVTLGTRTVKDGITADASGRWTTTFNMPAGAGGNLAVNAYGPSTVSGTVTPIAFSITAQSAINPAIGKVGTNVIVTGSSFAAGDTVAISWDGTVSLASLTAGAGGEFTATVTIPAAATGAHKVRVTGAQSAAAIDSTFNVAPDLAVSPTSGNVGSAVSLTGTGFGAGRALTVTWDGTAVTLTAGVTTGTQGSFTATFAAPRSKSGSHALKVSDGASSLDATWSMESTAPSVPATLKPSKGEIKSLFGDADLVFEWSAVTDPSGLSYTLQVARDEQFTDVVVNQKELSVTTLTVSKAPLATYYWRVKAVDFASNESAWSPVIDVKSGFMPVWAFALSIVGVIAVLFLVIRFFMRRSSY